MSLTELDGINIYSKAELLRKLDETTEMDEQLLESLQTPLKESLTREDWINYALLCKQKGELHKTILAKIPYSDSWLRKYVTPRLKEDTERQKSEVPPDTFESQSIERHFHPVLDFRLGELHKATRKFSGWGSVEVKDSQSDKLPIDGLKKIMPTYMQRGAPIMFGHSNRHVGRILKYEFRDKEVTGKSVPGLWLEGLIFSNYKIDDQAWESIQLAKSTAKPVLSLGATPVGEAKFQCEDNECFRKFDDLQIYEFTVTDLVRGQQGANPEATIETALTKADKEKDETNLTTEVEKGVIWNKKISSLNSTIRGIQKVISIREAELSKFKKKLDAAQKKRDAAEGTRKSDSDPADFDTDLHLTKEEEAEIMELSKEDGQALTDAILQLAKSNEAVIARLEKLEKAKKADEVPPPKEEEEEDEDKKKIPPADQDKEKEKKKAKKDADDKSKETPPAGKEPVLALSEHGLTAESFDELAKKQGYTRVGKGPAPDVSKEREITQGTETKKGKLPTAEQNIQALLDMDMSTLK